MPPIKAMSLEAIGPIFFSSQAAFDK